jgi:pimeloyl-ACP methyl ester carboxylesterase
MLVGTPSSSLCDEPRNLLCRIKCQIASQELIRNELQKLLEITDVPTPYVLVGHSLGGLYARHFAQFFPKEIAGLALLDPAHEDYDAFMPKKLNELRMRAKAGFPGATLAFVSARTYR